MCLFVYIPSSVRFEKIGYLLWLKLTGPEGTKSFIATELEM